MAISELRLIMRWAENRPRDAITSIPSRTRGLYVLLNKRPKLKNKYDVVYIGMAATGGIKSRLRSHARSEHKRDLWTHFSIFEVWPNITASEVAELEGLFRHIYRKDTRANKINRQKSFKKLGDIRNNKLQGWPRVDV